MRLIAVTCQNARTVTPHAGRCRRFFLFGDGGGPMVGTVELLQEEVLHAAPLGPEHPLAPIQVLISGGMGQDLYRRLSARGIQVYLTQESSPEMAVRLYLAGVPSLPCNDNSGCGHDHEEEAEAVEATPLPETAGHCQCAHGHGGGGGHQHQHCRQHKH